MSSLEVVSLGIDTVRDVRECFVPYYRDSVLQSELVCSGWTFTNKTQLNKKTGEIIESSSGFYQSPDNPTIRAFLFGGGYLALEFSAPRVVSGLPINIDLVSSEDIREVTNSVLAGIKSSFDGQCIVYDDDYDKDIPSVKRIDYAVDVKCHSDEIKSGLISASSKFMIPHAKKVDRSIFPNETASVGSPSKRFRAYDKFQEMYEKSKSLRDERDKILGLIESYKRDSVVRLEYQQTPKRKLHYDDIRENMHRNFADSLEVGFSGGQIYVGGLDYVREVIDGNAELGSRRKNTLIAFAVRYATLGEDALRSTMSRPTFYRSRKQFLDLGLRLEDLSTYSGMLDLSPIINEIRSM